MLTAYADLQVGFGRAAPLDPHLDQRTDTDRVETGERVPFDELSGLIQLEKLGGVVPGKPRPSGISAFDGAARETPMTRVPEWVENLKVPRRTDAGDAPGWCYRCMSAATRSTSRRTRNRFPPQSLAISSSV